jgi:hypothetical protein
MRIAIRTIKQTKIGAEILSQVRKKYPDRSEPGPMRIRTIPANHLELLITLENKESSSGRPSIALTIQPVIDIILHAAEKSGKKIIAEEWHAHFPNLGDYAYLLYKSPGWYYYVLYKSKIVMVYLIHFEKKIGHAQHYIGFCYDERFAAPYSSP